MENLTIKHLSDFNEMLYQRLQDVEHRLERLKIICASLGGSDFSEITTQITKLESDISVIKLSIQTNTNSLSQLNSNIQTLQSVTSNHTSKLTTHDEQLKAIDIDTITQNQQRLTAMEAQVVDNASNIIDLNANTLDLPTIRDRSLSNSISVTNLKSSFESYKTNQEAELFVKFGAVDVKIGQLQEVDTQQNVEISTLQSNEITNSANIESNTNKITELQNYLNNNKIENELSFIINGTYLLESDLDQIIDGTYTI